MAVASRVLVFSLVTLYLVQVSHSRATWGFNAAPKTRIIISPGPPIPQYKSASYKLAPSSSRSTGRRHYHGPGRSHHGFKPSLEDCAKQGEWKPIVGVKPKAIHFDSDLKAFQQPSHQIEHHELPHHNIDHDSIHHFDSSHHKDEHPIREVKPASWSITSSNVDFGGNDGGHSEHSDFSSNSGGPDFESNSDFGSSSNSDNGGNSVSFGGTPPWWKNNDDDFFKTNGHSGDVSSNHAEDAPEEITLVEHTSKDYAVHEKVEDIPPPRNKPMGGRQIIPSIVPSSTPRPGKRPPPPPPPPSSPSQSSYRPNFFRKRRQKPSVTYHLIPTKSS